MFKTILGALGLAAVVTLVAPFQANAQNPPAGAIFDLATVHPTPLGSYTQFNTSFVANATSEFVSFAFREVPAFWAFDDVSVTTGAGPNLLSSPSFEGATLGQNCNHNNALGCPPGWQAWIQPIDTSAIGQINTSSNTGGCNVQPHSGTTMWCDGSVQGYDAVYQQLTGLTIGATYNISFWLQDDSGSNITNPGIDMLVYAGAALPDGTIPASGTPSSTPVPPTIWLTLAGLSVVGFYFGMRTRRA